MAASDVIIKFSAEDNLTPELKKQLEALKQLQNEYNALDLKIKDLKADKKGILAGTVISDIEDIKKLQIEIAKLKDAYKLASRGEKTSAKNALKAKQIELEARLTKEINRQTLTLKRYKEELNYSSKALEKEYLQKKKVERATKSEDKASQRLIKTKRKENSIRASTVNAIVRHLRQVETLVLAYYAVGRAIDVTIKRGIDLNRTIEDGTVGIAALIAANTQGGNSAERFSAAMAISSKTMLALKKASVETAATFPQLTEVFQQAIGGALGAGQAMGKNVDEIIKHTIKLSQRMTNIASSIGMPMDQVNQEIRAIMEGTITKDARIAKMLGITTKDIDKAKKSADGLFKYLEKRLEVFDVLADQMTLSRAVARFTDALDTIRMDATRPIFEDLKYEVIDVTKELKNKANEWIKSIQDTYFKLKAYYNYYGDVISSFSDKIEEAYNKIKGIINDTLSMLEKATSEVINFLSVSNKVTVRVEDKTLEDLQNILKQKQEELKNSDSLWNELFGTSSKKSLENDIARIKRKIALLEREKSVQKEKGQITVDALSREIHGVDGLYQAYKEVYAIANKKFTTTSQLADYVTKIVQKYKQYPEILKTLGHEVSKQMDTLEGKTKLTLQQQIKLQKEIIKTQKLWQQTPLSKSIDRKTYFKDMFAEVGYTIKAYDKAVELYQKAIKKYADDPKALEIIKKEFNAKIQGLNEVALLRYKNHQKELENIKKEKKEYLRLHGSIMDGIRDQLKNYQETLPTAYENGIEIMKSITQTLDDAWTNFFDRQSNAFMDFGKLGKSIINDIEKQIVKTQIVAPLTQASSNVIGSVTSSLMDSLFDGWANGGYTYRDSSDKTPVGVVHANEYVIPANMVRKHPSLIAGLEAERRGLKRFDVGGFGGGMDGYGGDDLGGGYGMSHDDGVDGFGNGGNDYGDGTTINTINTQNFVTNITTPSSTSKTRISSGISPADITVVNLDPNAKQEFTTFDGYGNPIGNNGHTVSMDGTSLAGKVIGTILGAFTGSPLVAAITGKVGEKLGSKVDNGATTSMSFGSTSLDAALGVTQNTSSNNALSSHTQNTVDTLTGIFGDDLSGDGGSFYQDYTGQTIQQATDDINKKIIEANKADIIKTTQDLWQSMVGAIPDVKTDATEDWTTLFNNYIKDGNKALLQVALDGSLFDTPDFYSVWEDYAKNLNESVDKALKDELTKYTQYERDWQEWLYDRSGDTLKALKYKADYLKQDFEKLEDTLSISGVTVDNFMQRYTKAIQNNLTPDKIDKWDSLGDALKKATIAQEAYNKALINSIQQQRNSYISTLNSLATAVKDRMSEVNNLLASVSSVRSSYASDINKYKGVTTSKSNVINSLSKFSLLSGSAEIKQAFTVKNVIDSYYTDAKAKIEATYNTQVKALEQEQQLAISNAQSRYNSLKQEHDAIKSVNDSVKALHDYATSILVNSVTVSPKNTLKIYQSLFNRAFGNLRNAISANNIDGINKYSNTAKSYAQEYLTSAKQNSTTSQQYAIAAGVIASKFNSLSLKDNVTLGNINSSINAINNTFASRISSLQDNEEDSLNALKSETIHWLTSVDDKLKTEQSNLTTIRDSLASNFPNLIQPVDDIELTLQKMEANTLPIKEVEQNINNTAAHYSKLESLLAATNAKLAGIEAKINSLNHATAKVVSNTDTTADTIFTQGVA